MRVSFASSITVQSERANTVAAMILLLLIFCFEEACTVEGLARSQHFESNSPFHLVLGSFQLSQKEVI